MTKQQTAENPSGKQESTLTQAKVLAQKNMDAKTKKLLKIDEPNKEAEKIIKRVKITNTGSLEVEYIFNGANIFIKSKALIHKDLKNAFEELVPHWAMLCDLKEVKKLAQIYEDVSIIGVHNLKVYGYSFGTKIPATGCILMGLKQINTNKHIGVTTPFTEFDSENESYPFSGYLAKALVKVNEEVILYLDGKCRPPEPKLELNGQEEYALN